MCLLSWKGSCTNIIIVVIVERRMTGVSVGEVCGLKIAQRSFNNAFCCILSVKLRVCE